MEYRECLLYGETLLKGEKIWSPNRYWTLSIGSEGTLIAGTDTPPRNKNYILTLWAIGEPTSENIQIKLNDNAVIDAYRNGSANLVWSKDDISKSMPAEAQFAKKLKPPFCLCISDEGVVQLYDNVSRKSGNIIWSSKNSLEVEIDVSGKENSLIYDENKIKITSNGDKDTFATPCENDTNENLPITISKTVEITETNSWKHETSSSKSQKHTASVGFKVTIGGKDSVVQGEIHGDYTYEHENIDTVLNAKTTTKEIKRSYLLQASPVIPPFKKYSIFITSTECIITLPYKIEDHTYRFKDNKGNLLYDEWVGVINGVYEGVSQLNCNVTVKDISGATIKTIENNILGDIKLKEITLTQ